MGEKKRIAAQTDNNSVSVVDTTKNSLFFLSFKCTGKPQCPTVVIVVVAVHSRMVSDIKKK